MNNRIMLALAGALTLGLTACSSDEPSGVEVNKYVEFKKGDVYTYDVYDRDDANARVNASKTVRVWTVDSTGLTYQGKVNVVKVTEVNYDGTGTTETGRDTLYLLATQEGKVYQYDVIGNIIGRIPVAATAASQIPAAWVQIGDVKSTGSASWSSTGGPIVKNVTIAGFPVEMTLDMNASHKGRRSVTVPAATYGTAYSTDHSVSVIAKDGVGSAELLNDSMMVHYDMDIVAGIIRQTLDSKSIKVVIAGTAVDQPIAGFEMELKSVTKGQ